MINFGEIFNNIFKTKGYTIENTLLYSFLYIFAFLLLYLLVKNKKVNIDKYFNINLVVVFSLVVLIRVSIDLGWVKELFLFYTPYMQILVLSLFSVNLVDDKKRKEFLFFYLILLILTIFLFIKKLPNFLIIPVIFIIFFIVYIFYNEKRKYYFLLPILSQILDGVYGNLGIYFFGYKPKHVIHTIILNYFGLELGILVFLILKFIILVLTIIIIEKYVKEVELKDILYLMLFCVGYNAGLRNSLLVVFHEI